MNTLPELQILEALLDQLEHRLSAEPVDCPLQLFGIGAYLHRINLRYIAMMETRFGIGD